LDVKAELTGEPGVALVVVPTLSRGVLDAAGVREGVSSLV
jgi:hypothetical protein